MALKFGPAINNSAITMVHVLNVFKLSGTRKLQIVLLCSVMPTREPQKPLLLRYLKSFLRGITY